ncbi:hypothetical protein AcV5_008221 [Taiwanofungus camphoratus]|nr:hypothetical protein AcV5_008221 [Antrodia cinnamomea]
MQESAPPWFMSVLGAHLKPGSSSLGPERKRMLEGTLRTLRRSLAIRFSGGILTNSNASTFSKPAMARVSSSNLLVVRHCRERATSPSPKAAGSSP